MQVYKGLDFFGADSLTAAVLLDAGRRAALPAPVSTPPVAKVTPSWRTPIVALGALVGLVGAVVAGSWLLEGKR